MANRNFALPFAGADGELAFPDVMARGEIGRGDAGKGVRRVQEWLTYHGQHLTIDGEFGPTTERLVRAFQSANGLRADGIVDRAT
jgi:peptidoglycan hydrolase-like protein with peptidoglycan-binding domain